MLTIIKNTFREALAKRIFIGYYIFYALVVLVMLFIVNVETIEGAMSFMDRKSIVTGVETGFLTLSWSLIIFFSIISTASFIPSMLEKGTIDLLISKPISRTTILMSKYLGAVLFVFISMVFLLGSIWLILSLKSSYWDFTFLVSIISISFAYAAMYSIVVFVGLTTNSSIISILICFFLIFVLSPILSIRETIIFPLFNNSTVEFILNFLYYVLPKPGEIKDITVSLINEETISFWKSSFDTENNRIIPSWMSLISSFIFTVVLTSISIYYFSRKDY